MKLLVVVDMQNDFVDGILGFPEAKEIVPRIRKKMDEYIRNGDEIIFTKDTHYENNYSIIREGRNLPIKHCIEYSKGWEIIDVLDEDDYYGFPKDTFGLDCLNIKNINQAVHKSLDQFETIEIVGVVTNLCVLSVAITLQANILYPDIIIDASCCAAPDKNMHNKALDIMEGLHMKVINR